MPTPDIAAAQRLADAVVDGFGLTPPVDVESLVLNHAFVENFDFGVPDLDAVLLGLDADEKYVFLDPTKGAKRRRFTLAHELGHILLPWHLAHDLMCNADGEGKTDDEAANSDPTGFASAISTKALEIRKQELEANAFAARVLVPQSFVRSIEELSVPDMLERLEAAAVSAEAGIRALAESLPVGFVFAMLDDNDCVERVWKSGPRRSGMPSPLGLVIGQPVDKDLATLPVRDSGSSFHYGRRIWWSCARMDFDLSPEDGKASDILAAMVEDHTADPASAYSMSQSISGIGGALVSEVDEASIARMAALLAIRLVRRVELSSFVSDPRFDDYVSARARQLHRSLLKRLYG